MQFPINAYNKYVFMNNEIKLRLADIEISLCAD